MTESVHSRRLFLATFAALAALHVALLSTARLYPFVDLPDHLAAATIARDVGDASNQFSQYYAVETLLRPNTFHLFFCSLKIFPSVKFANRVFFCLYAILLPLSVLLIVRKAGGNPWLSLFSFLFMYNVNVSWGFVGFAFGMPLVLIFYRFFLLEPSGMSTTPRRLLAAAMLALLFFVHLLTALFALLLLGISLAWRGRRSAGQIARGAVVAAPLVALVGIWWHSQGRAHDEVGLWRFLATYYSRAYADTLSERWAVLAFDNARLFAGFPGVFVALLFSLSIVAAGIVLWVAQRRGRRGGPDRSGEGAARDTPEHAPLVAPLFLGALFCVLALPNAIPGQPILYERFAPLFLVSIALVSSTRAIDRGRRLFAAALPALCVIHFALWADYFVSFNRENASFNASFLPDAAGGRKLAGLIYDDAYRGRPIYIHFPSYYIVWKKGVTPTTLIEYRFGPVRRKTGLVTLPKYIEWVGRFNNYDGRYLQMDYLLVRGGVPREAERFMPRFAPVRASGKWRLYERTSSAR
jgi:hypothetical protein